MAKDEYGLEGDEVVDDTQQADAKHVAAAKRKSSSAAPKGEKVTSPKAMGTAQSPGKIAKGALASQPSKSGATAGLIRGPSLKGMQSSGSKGFAPQQSMYSHIDIEGSTVQWLIMTESTLKEPIVRMKYYNRGDFASDIMMLYQNGIKREIQDIYYMLASMFKAKGKLTTYDINQFFIWFDVFSRFLNWYLQFEESRLLPFFQKTASKAGKSFDKSDLELRTTKKQNIEKELGKLYGFAEKSLHRSETGVVSSLPNDKEEFLTEFAHRIDFVVDAILDYLFLEEKIFLPVITSHVTKNEKLTFESEAFRLLHNVGLDGHLYFHILLRPMKVLEPSAATETKTRYLNQYGGGVFSMKGHKVAKSYEESKDVFCQTHTDILKEFLQNWNANSSKAAQYPMGEFGSPLAGAPSSKNLGILNDTPPGAKSGDVGGGEKPKNMGRSKSSVVLGRFSKNKSKVAGSGSQDV